MHQDRKPPTQRIVSRFLRQNALPGQGANSTPLRLVASSLSAFNRLERNPPIATAGLVFELARLGFRLSPAGNVLGLVLFPDAIRLATAARPEATSRLAPNRPRVGMRSVYDSWEGLRMKQPEDSGSWSC